MQDNAAPLTDDERAELELLRAQKAAREEEERARQERAELERLRAESVSATRSEAQRDRARQKDARVRAAREYGHKLMEPGDDLSMPLGQKIVLGVLALIVVAIVATIVFAPK